MKDTIMSESFNPQSFFKRSDSSLLRDFFAMHGIADGIDWETSAGQVNSQVYKVYLDHKQDSDILLEETLVDIHSVASKAESRDAAYRIFAKASCEDIVQEIREKDWSVQNIVLWAYMHLMNDNGRDRWEAIARQAEAEKLNLSLMFTVKVMPLADAADPGWVPDEEGFKADLSENLLENDGCGRHIQIQKVASQEEDSYFIYYDRIRRHKNVFDANGAFKDDEIDRDANDLCFVHDKVNGKVYVRAPKGSRKPRKLKLCQSFAAKMLNMKAEIDDPDKISYRLNHIRDCGFAFTQDAGGKIESVTVSEICVVNSSLHNNFLALRTENSNKDLLANIQDDDAYRLFRCCNRIVSVTLKVRFSPEFSKRKNPLTVKITTDSLTKIAKPEEREVIERQLREWGIDEQ